MRRAEAAFGFGILALGGFMLAETVRLPAFARGLFIDDAPGAAFLPLLVSLGLVACGLASTWRGAVAAPGDKADGAATWPGWEAALRIAACVVALGLAIASFDFLGFTVTVILLIGALLWLLGTTSLAARIVIPIATAVILQVVFGILLKVPLPAGLLRPILG